jgi:uncharacterized protein YbaR (Trm112 family)/SAM-dependent methyltransferase
MANRDCILNALDIATDDWVLEIGGGPNPFGRSDILADKYLAENLHRAGDLIIDRPLVICDAHYLPFIDDSFNYTFCSQVLEHLENPELFFREIKRVSKKGYIEAPNEIRERLFGWPFHKWVIDKDEKGLTLRENNLPQEFGLFFHKLQMENFEFAMFCMNWHELLNICYEWHVEPRFTFGGKKEEKITTGKVYIDDKIASTLKLSQPYRKSVSKGILIPQWIRKRIPDNMKQLIKRNISPPPYGYRHSTESIQKKLKEILACPLCKRKVHCENNMKIMCANCGRSYQIINGTPIMLINE